MKTNEFIREKLYLLVIGFLTSLVISLFLFAIRVNTQVIAIIIFLVWLQVIAVFLVEYVRRATYYRQLQATLDGLDQKYLLTEIIDEPLFMDGRVLYDTLKTVNKSMCDYVNTYKLAQNEYKDYIEMWVHEIKTPLAASKLIISNNSNSVTESINEEIEKVESFVEQALFYARSTALEKDYIIKPINLQSVVSKIIRKHSKVFIYKKIKVDLENLAVEVYCDNKWLEFIVEQIISNALKYTKQASGEIRIFTTTQEHTIYLHIQDNGVGIDTHDIDRIFEKGFTGKNGRTNEKATGIGLYLCKTLCEKLYLSIDAQSQVGTGTTIIIGFPISKLMLLK